MFTVSDAAGWPVGGRHNSRDAAERAARELAGESSVGTRIYVSDGSGRVSRFRRERDGVSTLNLERDQ